MTNVALKDIDKEFGLSLDGMRGFETFVTTDAAGSVFMQFSNLDPSNAWTLDQTTCVNNMRAPIDFCNANTDRKQGGVAYDPVAKHGYTSDVNFSGNGDNVPSPDDFPIVTTGPPKA